MRSTPTAARVHIETALAVVSGLLGVLTAVFHGWLEVFGWDPDHGNGAVEAGIVLGLLVAATLLAIVARRHRRVLLRAA
ncbi:hypothetical protein V3N99_08180 [Dermatophilaceae bacterium Soc4.6]